MGFVIRNLQTSKLQLSTLRVFKTLEIKSTVEFLSSEAGANNCSKQQLKLPGKPASALHKRYPNTDFFLVRIQSKYGKIRARKNSLFGHFLRSGVLEKLPQVRFAA